MFYHSRSAFGGAVSGHGFSRAVGRREIPATLWSGWGKAQGLKP